MSKKEKSTWLEEEDAFLLDLLQQYDGKPIPQSAYNDNEIILRHPTSSIFTRISHLRRALKGDKNAITTLDHRMASVLAGIYEILKPLATNPELDRYRTENAQLREENEQLKNMLRNLKDIRAAVEKFQSTAVM